MPEQKVIPESCWKCKYSVNCYSTYGEGCYKYRIAIENADRKKEG